MAKYTIEEETLTSIANAIREKTGETSTISPLDMPAAIMSFKAGVELPPIEGTNQYLILDDAGNLAWENKISVTPLINTGTKLASINIGGEDVDLYYEASSVSLNGTATTSASFYAPTTAGSNGQILMSNGNGEPSWGSGDWISKSGDTITGDILRRVTEADVLQSNNGITANLYPTIFYMVDNNYNTISKIESSIETSGSLNSRWHVRNYNADGSISAQIGILLTATKNGWTQCRVEGDALVQGDLIAKNMISIQGSSYPQLHIGNASGQTLALLYGNMANDTYNDYYGTVLRVYSSENESEHVNFQFEKNGDFYAPGQIYSNKQLVLTTANYTSYCAKASHTHSYLPLSGGTLSAQVSGTSFWANQSSGENQSGVTYNGGSLYFWGNNSSGTAGIWDSKNATWIISRDTSTNGYNIKGQSVYGAVWNDYAEYRSQNETIEPGYITYCDDDGKLKKTTERLQKFEGVVSDTFGFAIGETDDCKTPLAVSGRVLVYCDPEEEHFHSGDCVCAGPDGLAYRMTREEIIEFPDRIVGVVSEIPTYETWGTGNVEVNGRIWIKVK